MFHAEVVRRKNTGVAMQDDSEARPDESAATQYQDAVGSATLEDAVELMRDLRSRCDWDRAQTHTSLRPYLIEEAHEVDEAIAGQDDGTLRDELGDLLLQILFHSVIAEERQAFSINDVAAALISKMHARHPHLYGDGVKRSWESMKSERHPRETLDEGLPVALPSLHRAHRLQDRAAGAGFDWPDATGPMAKIREETEEVSQLLSANAEAVNVDLLEDEIGDLLFAVVNLARKTGVHASLALDRANRKFTNRYAAMNALAMQRDLVFSKLSLAEQDALWDVIKQHTDQSIKG